MLTAQALSAHYSKSILEFGACLHEDGAQKMRRSMKALMPMTALRVCRAVFKEMSVLARMCA